MGRGRARKGFLALLTLTPMAVVAGDHQPAAAIPHIQYFGEEYEMKLAGFPGTLCVGQKKTITAWVKQYGLYKNLSTSKKMSARRPRIYRKDSGVGSLGLARVNVQIDNPSVLADLNEEITLDTVLWIRVTVKATKVGTTNVNITAESPGVMGAAKTLSVKVTDCDYKVHVFSIWHLVVGRGIVAGSSIDTIITGKNHPPGSIYNEHASAENTAVNFGDPCSAIYELPPSPAGVFAKQHDDMLEVELDRDPVDATIAITCSIEHGGSQGPATIDPITVQIPVGGGGASGPQVTHIPSIGDFTGMTYITLTPIPR